MAKKIKGVLDVGKTAYSNGKSIVTSLNGVNIDSENGFTIDSYTSDHILKIISVLPVSNFPMNNNLITSNGYIVNFNSINPVLLSGNFFKLPISSIDLSTIKSNPSNTTFYVYIILIEGLPKYTITDIVISESNIYNLLWIGTIITNESEISEININSRSRLDMYSPSITEAGSSFPVSTGFPSDTGVINW